MKNIVFVTLILLASFAAFAGASAGDAEAVEGMWRPIKAELSGQPMDDATMKSISLKLQDGKYEVLVGDKPDKGTYTIDPTSNPRSMTITGTEGPNLGKTYPAIYELSQDANKGDTLRICYDLSCQKRPEKFESVAGTKLYLVTYRREKK